MCEGILTSTLTLYGVPIKDFYEVKLALEQAVPGAGKSLTERLTNLIEFNRILAVRSAKQENALAKATGVRDSHEKALLHWRKEVDKDSGEISRLKGALDEKTAEVEALKLCKLSSIDGALEMVNQYLRSGKTLKADCGPFEGVIQFRTQ